jgi:membrane protease YdiL (CAAX protease family)
MPSIRPNVAIVTLVLEVVWLVIAVAAYEAELGDNVNSTAVSFAAIALIWASPAIALCVVAWLVEQALRMRELAPPRPMASPQPPPQPIPPQSG